MGLKNVFFTLAVVGLIATVGGDEQNVEGVDNFLDSLPDKPEAQPIDEEEKVMPTQPPLDGGLAPETQIPPPPAATEPTMVQPQVDDVVMPTPEISAESPVAPPAEPEPVEEPTLANPDQQDPGVPDEVTTTEKPPVAEMEVTITEVKPEGDQKLTKKIKADEVILELVPAKPKAEVGLKEDRKSGMDVQKILEEPPTSAKPPTKKAPRNPNPVTPKPQQNPEPTKTHSDQHDKTKKEPKRGARDTVEIKDVTDDGMLGNVANSLLMIAGLCTVILF